MCRQRSPWQDNPVWETLTGWLGEGYDPEPGKKWGAGREKTEGLPHFQEHQLLPCLFPTFGTKLQHALSPWDELLLPQPPYGRGPRLRW